MSILNDALIFVAVIEHGGFSHAAKSLGLSNGLVSRRISCLEAELGVSLIKRTTRRFQLTPEGELFWQYAQTIQQETNAAIQSIRDYAGKPWGIIRISAPNYLGRHYLTPIIIEFLTQYPDIQVDLELSNQRHDLIKERLDLVIRGSGFIEESFSAVDHLRGKLLLKDKIGLYASPEYLQKKGKPTTLEELAQHIIISSEDSKKPSAGIRWNYYQGDQQHALLLQATFNSSDIESSLIACIKGFGIGKFTRYTTKHAMQNQQLVPIMENYDWGQHHLYGVYSNQQKLPQRTRLLLDFIQDKLQY